MNDKRPHVAPSIGLSPDRSAPTVAAASRSTLRAHLRAARSAVHDRPQRTALLSDRLRRWLGTVPLRRLGFYLPRHGEPDLREIIAQWLAADANRQAALPIAQGDRLVYVPWTPASALAAHGHGFQAPNAAARISPHLLLVPCLGIDGLRYRLDEGDGWIERTLATLSPRPVVVGIAFACGEVVSIAPLPTDARLDLALTEARAW